MLTVQNFNSLFKFCTTEKNSFLKHAILSHHFILRQSNTKIKHEKEIKIQGIEFLLIKMDNLMNWARKVAIILFDARSNAFPKSNRPEASLEDPPGFFL